MNTLPSEFERITKLYAQTKRLILRAEELDPELRSCIPVIKEIRDAFDHLMRYTADDFAQSPQGEEYRKSQLDKAVGHVFRAAYDALDCLAICLKLRVNKALDRRSQEAIAYVFPDYFNTYVDRLAEIDQRILESRERKDVGNYTSEHLDNYLKFLEELEKICKAAETRVPAMVQFDRKNSMRTVGMPVIAAIVGALLGALFASVAAWLLK